MPIRQESAGYQDSERNNYDFIQQARIYATRRHITRLGISYFGFDAENFRPRYTSLQTYDNVIPLLGYFYELLPRISEDQYCECLQTDDGVHYLSNVIRSLGEAPQIRDQSDEFKTFGNWLMRDSEIMAWLQKSEIHSWHDLHRSMHELYNQMVIITRVLYFTLKPGSPYRSILLKETSFMDLKKAIQKGRGMLLEYLENEIEPENLIPLIQLLKFVESDAKNWSQKLHILDLMSHFTGFRLGGYGKYEHALAQVYFDEHPEVSDEFLPLYLAHGRIMAFDTRSTRELNPVTSSDSLPERNYQPIDEQESDLDPRSQLLPLIGIEVEAEMTPGIQHELYEVLAKLVVNRGNDAGFEYSARPVRQAETLKFLYEKLFEGGFIDLFKTTDYSTHWNANVSCHDLYRETLAGLALTGLLSDGRSTTGIHNALFGNSSGEGMYYEWKQGDLYHLEQLMMAIDIFHAVVTAQKNYEKVVKATLMNKGMTKGQAAVALETYIAEKAEFEREAIGSAEEKALAMIYLEYREQMRNIFPMITQLDLATVDNFIQGDRTSMQATHRILETVYPEMESILESDPATFVSDKSSRKAKQQKIAHQIVAAAQAVATETLHRVQKVLAKCYSDYLENLLSGAEILVEEVTPEKIQAVQLALQPVGSVKSLHRQALDTRVKDVIKRLEYGLRQTRYDDAQRSLISEAIQKLSVFRTEAKKAQRQSGNSSPEVDES